MHEDFDSMSIEKTRSWIYKGVVLHIKKMFYIK
jgi:hypothetical protein